jgi:hypothetical protein
MKAKADLLTNEKGSTLIVALLILVVLTIIGVSATTTTEIELKIAGNDQFRKVAFHNADSGVYSVPKLISLCMDNGSEQSVAGMTYTPSDGTFYREIMGFDGPDAATDVLFSLGGFNVNVDVNRTGAMNLAGGGVEFASGAEGVGVGSGGGVAIFFDMDSFGGGPGSSVCNIGGVYRKVVGVVGGL